MAVFVMTPRLRIRRRRSSSRHVKIKTSYNPVSLGSLVTTILLAVILMIGPLVLGATRLWVELPLLVAVAFLLMIQGMRLIAPPAEGTHRRADAIDLTVALFVLYAVVRWLTSPAEYFSRVEVMEIVAYAGVFLTCRHGMANRRFCMALLYLLVVLGVGETAFGYYLSNHPDSFPFGWGEKLQFHYAPRWLGTYESPNHYANLLVMAIGAGLSVGSFSKLPWTVRIIFIYLALMMIVGLLFSKARGSWVALEGAICGLVLMGIRNGTARSWVPMTAGAVLIVLSAVVFSLSPLVQNRPINSPNELFGGMPDLGSRVLQAQDALGVAKAHPLFGTGPGTSVFTDPSARKDENSPAPAPIHDDYLNCLDDYGLIGFALAMFFIAAVTFQFFRPLWLDNRWQDRVLVATGFSVWLALLLHSLCDFNLHVPANALLFFSLIGLGLGRLKEEKARRWSTLSLNPLGRWLGMGVILLSLVYGFLAARTALSENMYEKVLAYENEVPFSESITSAEQALAYDRGNAPDLVLLGDLHRAEASLQKTSSDRLSQGMLALQCYKQALEANGLDEAVRARVAATLDFLQKNSDPHQTDEAAPPR